MCYIGLLKFPLLGSVPIIEQEGDSIGKHNMEIVDFSSIFSISFSFLPNDWNPVILHMMLGSTFPPAQWIMYEVLFERHLIS